MDIILKPNQWYDNLFEPYRFYIMIGLFLASWGVGFLIGIPQLGMFIFALFGLYRVSYFIKTDMINSRNIGWRKRLQNKVLNSSSKAR